MGGNEKLNRVNTHITKSHTSPPRFVAVWTSSMVTVDVFPLRHLQYQ